MYFTIFGDDFPLDTVTRKLGIRPTQSYVKGDVIPRRSTPRFRKETAWELGTGYQESYDVSDQLNQVISKLADKEKAIVEVLETYSLLCKIFIVIKINNGATPSLYLDRSVISFASRVGAEFDIDLYANPYEDGTDRTDAKVQ